MSASARQDMRQFTKSQLLIATDNLWGKLQGAQAQLRAANGRRRRRDAFIFALGVVLGGFGLFLLR